MARIRSAPWLALCSVPLAAFGAAASPPATETVPVAEAVRRILSAPIAYWKLDEPLRELEALGPEALPALTAEVGGLSGWPLVVAANRLAAAGHKDAAPALAQRLRSPDRSQHGDSAEVAVLDAVAVLGGPGQVGALRGVLEDGDRSERVRLHAHMALAVVGTPDALEAMASGLRERRRRQQSGFTPPSAADFVDLIGRPVDEAAQRGAVEREDFVEYVRLGRGAEAARVPRTDGTALVVFPDNRLGNWRDLWAQDLGADGAPAGGGVFLGLSLGGRECHQCPIEAALQGHTLTVKRRDGSAPAAAVDLASVARDSDGDGLSDLVESRLRTHPAARDSDADGLEDLRDPFPLERPRAPTSEAEEATAAVFEQFHLFKEDTLDLAVFVSDFAPPASGRKGPTLVVSPKELDDFKATRGFEGVEYITIGPAAAFGATAGEQIAAFTGRSDAFGPVDALDRVYHLSIFRGPLNAEGHLVVVRKMAGEWVTRYLRQTSVS